MTAPCAGPQLHRRWPGCGHPPMWRQCPPLEAPSAGKGPCAASPEWQGGAGATLGSGQAGSSSLGQRLVISDHAHLWTPPATPAIDGRGQRSQLPGTWPVHLWAPKPPSQASSGPLSELLTGPAASQPLEMTNHRSPRGVLILPPLNLSSVLESVSAFVPRQEMAGDAGRAGCGAGTEGTLLLQLRSMPALRHPRTGLLLCPHFQPTTLQSRHRLPVESHPAWHLRVPGRPVTSRRLRSSQLSSQAHFSDSLQIVIFQWKNFCFRKQPPPPGDSPSPSAVCATRPPSAPPGAPPYEAPLFPCLACSSL